MRRDSGGCVASAVDRARGDAFKQIMNAIVMPNAQIVYNAVGTVSTAAGINETAPRSDKEWDSVANSAAAIVESGNLLLMSGRAVDNGVWATMTRSSWTGADSLNAAMARKSDDVFTAGGDLNMTCDSVMSGINANWQLRAGTQARPELFMSWNPDCAG